MTTVRLGVRLPHGLPGRADFPVAEIARDAEAAGWDSLWTSDHVVVPRGSASSYPYTRDRRLDRSAAAPWYDAIVTMSVAAAATSRIEVGTGVLVLGLRNPIVVAKQVATLDAITGGRIALGVGAGWLREEFEVLGVPYARRGRRLDEALRVLREIWTGEPTKFDGEFYALRADITSYPAPARPIPVFIGGMSDAALRRVAYVGDGWFAIQAAEALDAGGIRAGIDRIAAEAERCGRPRFRPRVLLRVRGAIEAARDRLGEVASCGVTDLIVDVADLNLAGLREARERLRTALDNPSMSVPV